jgi:hypothetical protein
MSIIVLIKMLVVEFSIKLNSPQKGMSGEVPF